MKEFQYKNGGRRLYNEDVARLQNLALSMSNMFKDCEKNFVISGCTVTRTVSADYSTRLDITVTAGFVWLDGKIREVSAVKFKNAPTNYIPAIRVKDTINDEQIRYADGTSGPGYYDYSAEVIVGDDSEITDAMIAYDPLTLKFPDLSSFFSYYGLSNSDLFLDITQATSFKPADANIYQIGDYPADLRISKARKDWFYLLDDEEIENGALAYIDRDEIDKWLSLGNPSVGGFYLHSNIVLQFYTVVESSETTSGRAVGNSIGSAFSITKTTDNENNHFFLVLTDGTQEIIRDALESDTNAIGIYLKILSGTVDSSDGQALTNSETYYFGVFNGSNPSTVWRFYCDDTQDLTVLLSSGSIEWANCSDYEKSLWYNSEFDLIEAKNAKISNNINVKKIVIDSPKNYCNKTGGIVIDGTTTNSEKIHIFNAADEDGDYDRVTLDPLQIQFNHDEDDPVTLGYDGLKSEKAYIDYILDKTANDWSQKVNVSDLVEFFIALLTNKKISIVGPNNSYGNHGGISLDSSQVNGQTVIIENASDDDGDYDSVTITPLGIRIKHDEDEPVILNYNGLKSENAFIGFLCRNSGGSVQYLDVSEIFEFFKNRGGYTGVVTVGEKTITIKNGIITAVQ